MMASPPESKESAPPASAGSGAGSGSGCKADAPSEKRAPGSDGEIPRLVPDEAARVVALALIAIALLGVALLSRLARPAPIEPMASCFDGAYRSATDGQVHCGAPPAEEAPTAEALSPHELLLVGTLLDLNQAGAQDLELIPGIGPKLAARIVEDRSARGPFARIEDIERVKGIGPKLAAIVRGYARVRAATAAPGE